MKEKKEKVKILIKSYDHKLLDLVAKNIFGIIKKSDHEATIVPLPIDITKFTVLRATFKFKDAREQFETRIHKRLITIRNAKEEVINSLRDFSLPGGVDIQIKYEKNRNMKKIKKK